LSRRSKLFLLTAPCLYIRGHSSTARCVSNLKRDSSITAPVVTTPQLRNGQLVSVPPILIRRLKSHFCSLPSGVDLILGLNGYIWICKHVRDNEKEGEEGFDAEAVYSNQNDVRLYATPCPLVNDLIPDRISTMQRERPSPACPISYGYWHPGLCR
jgi:hypothetical protein